jgi:glycogenin glucosyltransferase
LQGVFIFKPSTMTLDKLLKLTKDKANLVGGEQGLLNRAFPDWVTGDGSKRLPFVYNVNASNEYSYAPAYKEFKDQIKILRFAGQHKPWNWYMNRGGFAVLFALEDWFAYDV